MPVVHNPIKTNSDLDVYPTHEAKLGKGGYRTVANIAERDNIPFERCEEGMLVTVLDDNTNNNKTTTYILKQNTRDSRTWEKFINDGVNPDLTNRIVALETSSAKVDNEIVILSNEISTKASLDEHNNLVASLATYALKSDLNTLATKDELNAKLDISTYTTDKDTFATKDELNDKADISSLDTLATKDELKNLVYTKSEVDEKIADVVTGGSINLDGYVKKDEIVNLATKDELNNKADRSELDTKANSSDLQNLATKDELNDKLDSSVYTTDKATFATKDELNDKLDSSVYTTDKATFATKDELSAKLDSSVYTTDKATFATKDELNLKADLSSLDALATKAELSSLATKDELNAKLDISTYTTDKDTFTTKDELNNLVYTKSQVDEKIADVVTGGSINLDGYVKKDEIVNLATKDEVNAKLDSSVYTAEKVTFATKDELNLKADLSSLDDLATKTELSNKADRSELDTKANSSDLQNLATKTELSSLATKDELNAKLDISTYTTDKDTFATKTQLEGKANKDEVYSKTEIDDNYTTTEQLNLALSGKADKSIVDSLATKVEVNEKISKLATKDELASGLATKADSSIIPTLATKTELSSLATKDELNLKADISSLDDLATKTELSNKADISSLAHLATKTELSNKADRSELVNLATKDELNDKLDSSVYTTEKTSFATKDELSLLATKTELNNKADRSDLDTKANSSDLQNLATKEKVNEINSTLTNAIATKANADAVVNLTSDQTINGVKTFSAPPVSATNPTTNNQVANKAYVDNVAKSKADADATVNLTGDQSIAGAKTFTSNITAPNITEIQNSINTINTSLSTVVSDEFTPLLILKSSPIGQKKFTLNDGDGQDEINAVIAEANKYRLFRIFIDGTVTGNISLTNPNYCEIIFNEKESAKLVGSLLINSFSNSRVTRLRLENGRFSLNRYSRCLLFSDVNITAPAGKGAIDIFNGSTLLVDKATSLPVKTLNLTSDLYGIGLNYGSSFIAEQSLTINTTNTTTKVNVFRGSFASLTGTTLSGDGTDFNVTTNTVTPNGIIMR